MKTPSNNKPKPVKRSYDKKMATFILNCLGKKKIFPEYKTGSDGKITFSLITGKERIEEGKCRISWDKYLLKLRDKSEG